MAEEYLNINPSENFQAKEKGSSRIRNFLIFLVLIGVVASSFWISFQLGKRILIPIKKIPERRIEVAIPEPPPSIKALQELERIMTPEAGKKKPAAVAVKPVPVKKTMAIKPVYYKVQAGVFVDKVNAQALADKVRASGFEVYLKKISTGWRVQVGAFRSKSEAEALQNALIGKGFKSRIIYE